MLAFDARPRVRLTGGLAADAARSSALVGLMSSSDESTRLFDAVGRLLMRGIVIVGPFTISTDGRRSKTGFLTFLGGAGVSDGGVAALTPTVARFWEVVLLTSLSRRAECSR
jgi:hypothetical protein